MTLESYLRENFNDATIDYRMRAEVRDGKVWFYIHPLGKDGITLDFFVSGNALAGRSEDPGPA